MLRQQRIFYGSWVALAFSLIVFLSTGIRFTAGPFLKPVVADLELDRAGFSLVISLSLFLYGAFMPLVGRLVDRVGSRLVVTIGTFILAGALAATGMAPALWQLDLFYGVLVAAGLAATGHVIASAIAIRWNNVDRYGNTAAASVPIWPARGPARRADQGRGPGSAGGLQHRLLLGGEPSPLVVRRATGGRSLAQRVSPGCEPLNSARGCRFFPPGDSVRLTGFR